MDHADHVNLLRDGVDGPGGVWADLGAGRGAFTLALAELLGPGGEIHAVDHDAGALGRNAEAMRARFPRIRVNYHEGDYTRELALPPLDGIVIANALHYQRDQATTVRHLRDLLRPGGRVVIVEYNIEHGNPAVPHPVPYRRWEELARNAGFEHTELLVRRPSRTFGEIYSAASW